MNCPKCGAPMEENARFCTNCGSAAEQPAVQAAEQPSDGTVLPPPVYSQPVEAPVAQPVYTQPDYQQSAYTAPAQTGYAPEYRPLNPLAYIGYAILFCIPFIGLVSMIVLAINNDNINRRNYARAFIIVRILTVVIVVFGFFALIALGFSFTEIASEIGNYM